MVRRFAALNGLAIVALLSLLVATGCEQNQQMQTWNMGSSWNLFGGGTFNKNYNLQYPIGDTHILNPAAAGTINTNTKSNSYSRSYDLQYAVGPTQSVNQGGSTSWFSRPKPSPRRTAPYANSGAGSTTVTRQFNLQYDIGATQGVNGHKVAPGRRSSSYQRNYKLQYPIGHTQPLRGNRGGGFTARASTRPRAAHRGGTSMRSTRGGGSYVVRPGDTLTSIARSHYGSLNAGRWPEILNANRNIISRPDQIAPGMRLRIP